MARVSSTYMREERTCAIRTLSASKRVGSSRSSDSKDRERERERDRSLSHENMIKYVILISTVVCLAHSQRPVYAGTAGRYPLVLPQYTTTAAPPSLGNRIDSQNGQASSTGEIRPAIAASETTTAVPTSLPVSVPADLPVEAYGDANLLDTIKTWPRDQQPFWYLNQVHLNAHRGVLNVAGTATQPPQTLSRSFFAG